jgi:hypothetical protein
MSAENKELMTNHATENEELMTNHTTENKELMPNHATDVATYNPNVAYGFEDTKAEDIIIPRIKVVQAMSPERDSGDAAEGDIINSLTLQEVSNDIFIPVKQYYSNIYWNPNRDAEQRIFCRSMDGKIGVGDNGVRSCAACLLNQFDNSKQGKEAQPVCTAYLNFLGFFANDPMPVILSFAKTNYKEGRKLLSVARSLRCALWNYGYTLEAKKVTKGRNSWFIIVPKMAGPTTAEQRAMAFEVFKSAERVIIAATERIITIADYEEGASATDNTVDKEIAAEI